MDYRLKPDLRRIVVKGSNDRLMSEDVNAARAFSVHRLRRLAECGAQTFGLMSGSRSAKVRARISSFIGIARTGAVMTPAGRWGQPDEIAGTAVYLAAHASDFVTGATIRVDGGYSIT